jgi:DNA polymerase/3'-5' exonuclease PolX
VSSGDAVPLAVARVVADAVIYHMTPFAERIAVAGSVRRRRQYVRDIEIVMVPKVSGHDTNLFGEVERTHHHDPNEGIAAYNAIESKHPLKLRDVLGKDDVTRRIDGDRYKSFEDTNTGIAIDLFIVRPPATWGCIYFIRTGPADWNKKAMKMAHVRGLKFDKGQLVRQSTMRPIDTPEEEDVFRLLKTMIKPPHLRR